jgi:broad specificity phosphatase PhoE
VTQRPPATGRSIPTDPLASPSPSPSPSPASPSPGSSGSPAPGPPASGSSAWTGQVGAPTRLLLLRHGQTELSVHRRYSGHGDPELTRLGHDQAAGAAARLAAVDGVAAVLSSPLRRARQTAAVVAEALAAPLVVRPGLIETDFGAWEGLTFAQARERDPDLHARWLASLDVAPPDGESFAAVGARVAAERAEIVATYRESTVVVVSHVTPIKMLLREALQGGPELLFRLHLDLASLSVAEFYPDGGASVRLVNDTSHHPAPDAR